MTTEPDTGDQADPDQRTSGPLTPEESEPDETGHSTADSQARRNQEDESPG